MCCVPGLPSGICVHELILMPAGLLDEETTVQRRERLVCGPTVMMAKPGFQSGQAGSRVSALNHHTK